MFYKHTNEMRFFISIKKCQKRKWVDVKLCSLENQLQNDFIILKMCPLADSDCSALESEKEHKSLGSFVKALSSFSRKKVSI